MTPLNSNQYSSHLEFEIACLNQSLKSLGQIHAGQHIALVTQPGDAVGIAQPLSERTNQVAMNALPKTTEPAIPSGILGMMAKSVSWIKENLFNATNLMINPLHTIKDPVKALQTLNDQMRKVLIHIGTRQSRLSPESYAKCQEQLSQIQREILDAKQGIKNWFWTLHPLTKGDGLHQFATEIGVFNSLCYALENPDIDPTTLFERDRSRASSLSSPDGSRDDLATLSESHEASAGSPIGTPLEDAVPAPPPPPSSRSLSEPPMTPEQKHRHQEELRLERKWKTRLQKTEQFFTINPRNQKEIEGMQKNLKDKRALLARLMEGNENSEKTNKEREALDAEEVTITEKEVAYRQGIYMEQAKSIFQTFTNEELFLILNAYLDKLPVSNIYNINPQLQNNLRSFLAEFKPLPNSPKPSFFAENHLKEAWDWVFDLSGNILLAFHETVKERREKPDLEPKEEPKPYDPRAKKTVTPVSPIGPGTALIDELKRKQQSRKQTE